MIRPRKSCTGTGRGAIPVVVAMLLLLSLPVLAGTVSLRWNAVPDADVAGYRVYWGQSPGSHDHSKDVGNVTSTTVTGLANCTTWYFSVRAYDTGGLESPTDSNRVVGWPRPEITSVSPGAIEQGETLTFTVSGTNFYPGEDGNPSRPPARVKITWPGVVVKKTVVESCTRIRVTISAADDADLGWVALTVENPDLTYSDPANHRWVYRTRSRAFEVTRKPVDETPPTVRSAEPADGATGVPATVRPQVRFSEPVDPATVTTSTVRLLDDRGRSIPQDVGSPRVDGSTVTIVPANPLAAGKRYRIHVRGGDGGVADLAGNPLERDWKQGTGFRVAGDDSPSSGTASITGSFPAAGDTGVSLDLGSVTIDFDRDMSPLAELFSADQLAGMFLVRAKKKAVPLAPGSPRFTNGGRTVVLDLAGPLEAGATYVTCVKIKGKKVRKRLEAAGHGELFLGEKWCTSPGWTAEDGLLEVRWSDPDSESSGELVPASELPAENSAVPVDADFHVTFRYPVAKASLNTGVFRIKRGKKNVSLAEAPTLSDDGRTVILRPARPLDPGRKYKLIVRTGKAGVRLEVGDGTAVIRRPRKLKIPFSTEVSAEAMGETLAVAE